MIGQGATYKGPSQDGATGHDERQHLDDHKDPPIQGLTSPKGTQGDMLT